MNRIRSAVRRSLLLLLLGVVLTPGCGDYRSPTAPVVVPTPGVAPTPSNPNDLTANYAGDAIVVSSVGVGGCGWGLSVGETRTGVLWSVQHTADSISFYEDMDNWPTDGIPFEGPLAGHEFSGSYYQGDDYLSWVCQFKGASIRGTFSEDFTSFEATETLVWGPPDNESKVVRNWSVRRM